MRTYHPNDFLLTSWKKIKTEKQALQVMQAFRMYHQLFEKSRKPQASGQLKANIIELLCTKEKIFQLLTQEQILMIFSECTPWLQQGPEAFFLRKLRIKRKSYLAPNQLLKDLSFMEFVKLDTHFDLYATSGDKKQLDKFMGILYARKKNSQRRPFQDEGIEQKAKQMQEVKQVYKMAGLFCYSEIRKKIMQCYPALFPVAASGTENTKVKKTAGQMWHEILCDATELSYFSDAEAVKQANLHEVMMYLNLKAKRNENNPEPTGV